MLLHENFPECPQDLIPDDMPEGIIVVFERVQIEQYERQFPATLSRTDFSLEMELEMPAIG